MKRKDALEYIRIYTAKGDDFNATRIYAENRVSYKSFLEAREKGLKQKKQLKGE